MWYNITLGDIMTVPPTIHGRIETPACLLKSKSHSLLPFHHIKDYGYIKKDFTIAQEMYFNSSPPSATYMRR